MRRFAAILSVLLACLWISAVTAQSRSATVATFIYRIKSDQCTFAPKARRQTGFRVAGMNGIITALHGVADCTTVSAVTDDGQVVTDLEIVQVDIERDIALLGSPDLAQLPSGGLTVSPLTAQTLLTTTLQLIGYPLGLEKQDTDSNLSVRQVEPLDDVIPDSEEPVGFIKRKSPSLEIDVLNLQAQLLPGHSGAPLLDAQERLVGVGDGGLRGGTIGRSWAIPWTDVVLQSVSNLAVKKRLAELAAKDTSSLAFSSTYPSQQAEDAIADLPTYLVQIVDAAGKGVTTAEVLLTHNQGYTIALTDAEGFAVFYLAATADYRTSRLLVEAPGFAPYSRTVGNVTKKIGTEIVRLIALASTPTPVETIQWCDFAFRILDETNEGPIAKAKVIVTLGTRQSTGQTDSTGLYSSKLPCNDPQQTSVKVRILIDRYEGYTEIVPLVGEIKEILLAAAPSPTAPPPPSPTPTPQPPPTLPVVQAPPTPTPCVLGVDPALQAIWSGDLGCAVDSAHITWASYTPYERGMMMWREDTRLIYGFFQNNGWQAVEDRFQEGMPDMPNPNRGDPPPGLIHPIRGTGLAWATNETFYQNLGWAKTQQRGFCARIQNFVGGFIVQESGLGSCFDGKSNQEQASRATEAEFDFRFLKAYHSNQWSRN